MKLDLNLLQIILWVKLLMTSVVVLDTPSTEPACHKNFFLTAERRSGQIGDTFVFYIWYLDDVIQNKTMENFLVTLQYRVGLETRVLHECLLTEDSEESKRPLYVVSQSDSCKYNNVRKFAFILRNPGHYVILAVIVWGGVNNKQSEFEKSMDMAMVNVEVVQAEYYIPATDCLIMETFTINGEETSEDTIKHFVQVNNTDLIIVKSKLKNCTNSQGIIRQWKMDRLFSVTQNQKRFPSRCYQSSKAGKVNLSILARDFTGIHLNFPTNLNSFTIQPFLLPAGYYRICLELSRQEAHRNLQHTYCGFLTVNPSVVKDAFQLVVTPEEENFIWPMDDLHIYAGLSSYIYESTELGYAGSKTIRFKWHCFDNDEICGKIVSYYKTFSSEKNTNYSHSIPTEGLILLIKKSWMVTNTAVKILLEISAMDILTCKHFLRTIERLVTFSNKNEAAQYAPNIGIRCLINCWQYVNPYLSMLLTMSCLDCEQFSLEFVTISWEIQSNPSSTFQTSGNDTLYLHIENIKDSSAKEFIIKVIFIYKNTKGVEIVSSSTRKFEVMNVSISALANYTFQLEDSTMGESFPVKTLVWTKEPFYSSELTYPIIVSVVLSYNEEKYVLLRTISSGVSFTHDANADAKLDFVLSLPTGTAIIHTNASFIIKRKSIKHGNLDDIQSELKNRTRGLFESTQFDFLSGLLEEGFGSNYTAFTKLAMNLFEGMLVNVNAGSLSLILKVVRKILTSLQNYNGSLVALSDSPDCFRCVLTKDINNPSIWVDLLNTGHNKELHLFQMQPILIVEKVLAYSPREMDNFMDDLILRQIADILTPLQESLQYTMMSENQEAKLQAEGVQQKVLEVINTMMSFLVVRVVERYPHIKTLIYTDSILLATWLDSKLYESISIEMNYSSIRLDLKRLREAFNPFSFDPYLNIGAYETRVCMLPHYYNDLVISTSVVFLLLQQKSETYYHLQDFAHKAIHIDFNFLSIDLNRTENKSHFHFAIETQGNLTKNVDNSQCILLMIKPTFKYGTLLTMKSHTVSLNVTSRLYKLYRDSLDIFEYSSMKSIKEDSDIFISQSYSETVVFLHKLPLLKAAEYKNGHYFVLIRMNLPEIPYATQETPSNLSHGKHPLLQAQEEGLSIECLRLTCVRWLAAEQRWISRDCHPKYKTSNKSDIGCVCDEGRVFSGSTSACLEDISINWDNYKIAALDKDSILNLEIPFVIFLLWMVFVVILVRSIRLRKQDKLYGKSHVISSLFSPYQSEQFLVCFVTGWIAGAGTEDVVSMVLVGSNATSSVYRLNDICHLFKTGSEVCFFLSCSKDLGRLKNIILILERQKNVDTWFVQHIYLKNLKTEDCWFCRVDSWIPDTATGNNYVIKPVHLFSELPHKLFVFSLSRLLRSYHVCIGSIYNIQGSRFTKELHALTCFCCIIIIMKVCAWKIGLLNATLKGDMKQQSKLYFTDDLVVSVFISVFPTTFLIILLAVLTDRPLKYQVLRWKMVPKRQQKMDPKRQQKMDTSEIPEHTTKLSSAASQDTFQSSLKPTPILYNDLINYFHQLVGPQLVTNYYTDLDNPTVRQTDEPNKRDMNMSNSELIAASNSAKYTSNNRSSSLLEDSSINENKEVIYRPFSQYKKNNLHENLKKTDSFIVLLKNNTHHSSGVFTIINKQWLYNDQQLRWTSPLINEILLSVIKLAMVLFIVVESYVFCLVGVGASDQTYFIQLVLATFLIINGIIHPFLLIILALLLDRAIITSGVTRNRIEALSPEMFIAIKLTVLDMVQTNRLVGSETLHVSKQRKQIYRRIGQKESENTYFKKLLKIDDVDFSFNMIPSVEHVWLQLQKSFHKDLHQALFDKNSLTTFRVVNNVKLTQRRVKKYKGNCTKDFPSLIEPSCNFDIEQLEIESQNFALSWNKATDKNVVSPYTPQTGKYITTTFHSYPGVDYSTLYSLLNYKTETIDYLKDKYWIDERTRLVLIELSVFNADTSLITTIIHAFEFTAAGIFQSSIMMSTYQLLFEKGTLAMQAFILLFLALCIFFAYHDLVEVYSLGIIEYLQRPTSWLNIIDHAACFIIIILFQQEYVARKNAIDKVVDIVFQDYNFEVFIDFNVINRLSYDITVFCCIVALTSFIKIILATRHFQLFAQFLELLPSVMHVTYFPLLTILTFAFLTHFLFGQLQKFSTFSQSVLSVMELIVDQRMISPVFDHYWFWGPIFLTLTLMFLHYIVINYYICFLSDRSSQIYALNRYRSREKQQFIPWIWVFIWNGLMQRSRDAAENASKKSSAKYVHLDKLHSKGKLNVVNYDEQVVFLNELK
ncbi:uncharacterized protein LOC106063204 isoform X3 [Biomphalaria glabrata]|uniref:Uncharacterized protein LOC106063204 isoform X3 n=1 Tax=Biomphalaria glabrata TaxID=6526 RepID=A0A9W2YCK0_BIOGL|nr:uncharacterized protein LOC106063204 isoform X3 [Biomphalaria glabrata]